MGEAVYKKCPEDSHNLLIQSLLLLTAGKNASLVCLYFVSVNESVIILFSEMKVQWDFPLHQMEVFSNSSNSKWFGSKSKWCKSKTDLEVIGSLRVGQENKMTTSLNF